MWKPFALLAIASLPLIGGCGGSLTLTLFFGGSGEETASVASDPATDGDVRQDGQTAAAGAIRGGIDPLSPSPSPEFRGFLSFPIDRIPPGALVESATVTLFVDRIDLLPGSGDLFLDFDQVHYGAALSPSAFAAAGSPVRSVLSGVRLFPATGPQRVSFDVVPELQSDVDDPFVRFFQVRVFATGGLARIVDGAGNRAGGAPPDPALAPVLTARFRP